MTDELIFLLVFDAIRAAAGNDLAQLEQPVIAAWELKIFYHQIMSIKNVEWIFVALFMGRPYYLGDPVWWISI